MSRSLNSVTLIGNLTRDPEMRYTPQGTAVTSFGLATNRSYTQNGERKDEVEFHNIVAWGKLAELCSQLLRKGRKVYLHGRLQTKTWDAPDGAKRNRTEIVLEDMILLDNKFVDGETPSASSDEVSDESELTDDKKLPTEGSDEKPSTLEGEDSDSWVSDEDIPF